MFDAAIVGTGPAGLSAAINLKLHNKCFIWFGSSAFSDKVEKSEKIANYPGLCHISGPELNQHFRDHVQVMELTIEDKMVTNIGWMEDHYALLAENEMYEARTLLLATGMSMDKPLLGEENLLGSGVSYCATCDGFLYKGKTIAIWCGASRYEHEVRYLAELAGKVYLYAAYPDCTIDLPNVEMIPAPKEVKGRRRVTSLLLENGQELPVDGLFCLRTAVATSALLPDLQLDGPHIAVNRRMETNLPGCFAAGDCTGIPYQLAKAVGEGNTAAHSIIRYLADRR